MTATSGRRRYHGGGPAEIAPLLGLRGRRRRSLSTFMVLALAVMAAWNILTAPLTVASLLDEPPELATTTPGVVTPTVAASTGPTGGRAGTGVALPPGRSPTARRPQPPGPAPAPQPAPELLKTEVAHRVDVPPGVRVTDKQVQEVARAICQAFTDGYSWEQVTAALKKAGDRYNVSVSDADAGWAIRESVSSTCPQHQDKLP